MIKATNSVCKTCKYRELGVLPDNTKYSCAYIRITGKRRIRDESGEMCGSYESGKKVIDRVNFSL